MNLSLFDVAALITGIGGLIVSVITARGSVRRSEIDTLRGIIETLRAENVRLEDENTSLRERVLTLENIIRAGVDPVPEALERRMIPTKGLATL